MTDLLSVSLVMATLGQIALCVTLLMTNRAVMRSAMPLCVFFLACGAVIADPVIVSFMPSLRIQGIALTLPAYLIIAPALWLYVEALTNETPWTFGRKHVPHLIPFALGLILSLLVIALPQQTLDRIFFEEDLAGSLYLGILFTAVFILALGLIAQFGFYGVKIFRRLTLHRRRIKSLFADIEHRELFWMNGVLIFIIAMATLATVSIISENIFNLTVLTSRSAAFIGLAFVWSIGLWGLRQNPGFEGRYHETEDINLPEVKKSKYNRSALDTDQASRIAKKIETAMQWDKLYLDPTLSLSKLASHIGASANHVSQTLNETLGTSFFDYVNRWRIDAAKPQIISGQETILTIALAVGFNTSSSFYKAFKNETGETPRGYRKTMVLPPQEDGSGL